VTRKTSSTFTAGLTIVAVAVALAGPAAANSDKQKASRTHRAHHASAMMPTVGSPPYRSLPPNALRMPGYVFVPGRGILDEACNLPTSACPNSERDVQ
jgi:hypothetical protein